MIKEENITWILVLVFLIGFLTDEAMIFITHRHYHEVIKTNIGEFILKDGKIFTVYEMQRNINGDMVGR